MASLTVDWLYSSLRARREGAEGNGLDEGLEGFGRLKCIPVFPMAVSNLTLSQRPMTIQPDFNDEPGAFAMTHTHTASTRLKERVFHAPGPRGLVVLLTALVLSLRELVSPWRGSGADADVLHQGDAWSMPSPGFDCAQRRMGFSALQSACCMRCSSSWG